MHTTQTTLIDTTDDQPPTATDDTTDATTTATDREHAPSADATLAPPDQRGGQRCCPWCLAAAETFNHHDDGSVGCAHCDAAIPVGIPWYERGEKVVI